ncbi:MAG TPA: YegP family protein [Pyrinomonadaceae bacterium]|nr:YegP family protein [Pyrinomonadaceae bacterium]
MAGKFEIKKTGNGKYYFNLKASNGQIILSSELYETLEGVNQVIESVRKNASNLSFFEKRTSSKGNPYFILKANNGLELGRSEMFSSIESMEKTINSVQNNSPNAELVSLSK